MIYLYEKLSNGVIGADDRGLSRGLCIHWGPAATVKQTRVRITNILTVSMAIMKLFQYMPVDLRTVFE